MTAPVDVGLSDSLRFMARQLEALADVIDGNLDSTAGPEESSSTVASAGPAATRANGDPL